MIDAPALIEKGAGGVVAFDPGRIRRGRESGSSGRR
jgi:hypothetical protein